MHGKSMQGKSMRGRERQGAGCMRKKGETKVGSEQGRLCLAANSQWHHQSAPRTNTAVPATPAGVRYAPPPFAPAPAPPSRRALTCSTVPSSTRCQHPSLRPLPLPARRLTCSTVPLSTRRSTSILGRMDSGRMPTLSWKQRARAAGGQGRGGACGRVRVRQGGCVKARQGGSRAAVGAQACALGAGHAPEASGPSPGARPGARAAPLAAHEHSPSPTPAAATHRWRSCGAPHRRRTPAPSQTSAAHSPAPSPGRAAACRRGGRSQGRPASAVGARAAAAAAAGWLGARRPVRRCPQQAGNTRRGSSCRKY